MTKKIYTMVAAIAVLGLSASAALIINDPGFAGEFTAVGDPFDQTDSANFDKWVSNLGATEPGSLIREWTMPETGGNTDGYADGTFGNSKSYNRTMFQAVTDDKANTGLMDLVFDLNMNNIDAKILSVGVWGVTTLSGAIFSFDTAPGPTFGSNVGDAVSLASQNFTTSTTGWEEQTISNIDLGTGYDLVIIGFRSNGFSESATLGIDNVAMIPEPATMGMVGFAGLAMLLLRRRMCK